MCVIRQKRANEWIFLFTIEKNLQTVRMKHTLKRIDIKEEKKSKLKIFPGQKNANEQIFQIVFFGDTHFTGNK